MKKIVVTLLLFIGLIGYSQTNGITYQAVIINPSGEELPGVNNTNTPLANKYICLKFSIIDNNSQSEYIETIQTTTDEFGMVNLVIGSGVQIGGYASSFSNILWNNNPKSLKVDLSTTGVCAYYTEISNQPFTAVPFALYAVNSQSAAALAALQATVAANAAATTNALALKEDAINKSISTTLGTSNVLFPTQNAVKTYVDTNISTVNATVTANATATTTALALKENASNKSNAALGTSTTLFPTQNAVKTYVDNAITTATIQDADATTKGKIQLAGDLGGTAALPTVPGLALKANTADVNTALALKENASNKSNATLGTSTTLFPTQNAVKTYVDGAISTAATPDADATTKGKIQLAGDLGGTAALPTVPGLALKANTADVNTALALKEDTSNKSNATLGTSTTLFPTQNAVKTYVDGAISTAATPDADATTKGKIQLAGDLGGTAALPTVPGLALKANTADVNTALTLKEDVSNKSNATLGTSTTLFPTQNAVKTYVDNFVKEITTTETTMPYKIDGKQLYSIMGQFTASGSSALITIAKPAGMTDFYSLTTFKDGKTYRKQIISFNLNVTTDNVVTGSGFLTEVYPAATYSYVLEYFK